MISFCALNKSMFPLTIAATIETRSMHLDGRFKLWDIHSSLLTLFSSVTHTPTHTNIVMTCKGGNLKLTPAD